MAWTSASRAAPPCAARDSTIRHGSSTADRSHAGQAPCRPVCVPAASSIISPVISAPGQPARLAARTVRRTTT